MLKFTAKAMPYIFIFGIMGINFSFFLKKMIFSDSHLHLLQCNDFPDFSQDKYFCVSSCHSKNDVEFILGTSAGKRRSGYPQLRAFALHSSAHFCSLQNGFAAATIPCAFVSFGIHPQIVNSAYIKKDFHDDFEYLESLAAAKKIVAIGECGFDFFTPEFKSTAKEQSVVFEAQLALAQKFDLPLVLHLRKSIEKIFSYSKELKKVPAVVFHSFPGTLREAISLKNHGIRAFFSFGKPILNGKKSAIDCVKNLPIENLLFETDAPYQTLKDEIFTNPKDIKRVFERAGELRSVPIEWFSERIYENFSAAFLKF